MNTSLSYIIYGVATLTALVVLIIITIAIRRRWKLRKLKREQCAPLEEEESTIWPRLSVVVISQEHAIALERNLPSILEQDYPNFEVLVVDVASTDNTQDVIKRLQSRHDNLRSTFVSYGCKSKKINDIALMLGFRSARAEWVVVVSPDATPHSEEWLKRMARHINDDTDLVSGTATSKHTENYCMRKQKMAENNYCLSQAERQCRKVTEWSPQACIYQDE